MLGDDNYKSHFLRTASHTEKVLKVPPLKTHIPDFGLELPSAHMAIVYFHSKGRMFAAIVLFFGPPRLARVVRERVSNSRESFAIYMFRLKFSRRSCDFIVVFWFIIYYYYLCTLDRDQHQ